MILHRTSQYRFYSSGSHWQSTRKRTKKARKRTVPLQLQNACRRWRVFHHFLHTSAHSARAAANARLQLTRGPVQ
jgi:hypothetical protein